MCLPLKHITPNWTLRPLCWRVPGQITNFLIKSGSSLFQCVLKGPSKLLVIPVAGKDCLLVSHLLCQTQALRPGPPSSSGLGLLPTQQLVPLQPCGAQRARQSQTYILMTFKFQFLALKISLNPRPLYSPTYLIPFQTSQVLDRALDFPSATRSFPSLPSSTLCVCPSQTP